MFECLSPNLWMAQPTEKKQKVFVYLCCSMVTYHIHMGLSETTPQNYDHFDSWWSCSNVVKSWCLVHWSLNAPIFPKTKPWRHRVSQDLAVRDAFEAAPQGVALGMSSQQRGPWSTESPVLSSQIFSPFFWCCLMFMLNHYMIHDWVLWLFDLFADDGYW